MILTEVLMSTLVVRSSDSNIRELRYKKTVFRLSLVGQESQKWESEGELNCSLGNRINPNLYRNKLGLVGDDISTLKEYEKRNSKKLTERNHSRKSIVWGNLLLHHLLSSLTSFECTLDETKSVKTDTEVRSQVPWDSYQVSDSEPLKNFLRLRVRGGV